VNVFWIIVAVLVIAAIAGLLHALLRTRPSARAITQNLMLRDIRIAELRRDVADQVIDEQVLPGAEDEIARALLEESDSKALATDRLGITAAPWLMAAIIVCGVPAIAVLTYLNLGAPQLATGVAAADQSADSMLDQKTIDDLVARLQQRLVDDPDSAEGWLLLGRTYMTLNRYAEAVPALARAHELVGDVPQVLLQYADALAMADGGRIDNDVRALVTRALEVEPENVAALWLAGVGAAEAGERLTALEYLRQAQAVSARNGVPTAEIDAVIRELEAVDDTTHQPVATAPAASIMVTVNVDPVLSSRITAQDVLFVFARTPNQSGPPLAVTRRQADNLPHEVVLDDTMAMAPMFKLKVGETVEVTARISKSGTPAAQSGDLQATSEPFVVGEVSILNLVIDEVVE
jgi:cytochrome c-type biogenesis protein CcmH